MTSVIIAAHNEASVIGRCLDSLLTDAVPDEFEVIVVANGCQDRTAAIAATQPGVRLIELEDGNKSLALNAGDALATRYPRIYLDADIMVTPFHVRAIRSALLGRGDAEDAALAAVPARRLDLAGRPVLIRGYFAISSRLPAFRDGLFGRGMIGLSEAGRARFDRFPDMIADDLFLDSLFATVEKRHLEAIATTVATPRTTRDLVRRLVRVRRGNATIRQAARTGDLHATIRPADRWSWFTDVLIPHPTLLPSACAYVLITLLAELKARRSAGGPTDWGQDRSTREVMPGPERPDAGSRG